MEDRTISLKQVESQIAVIRNELEITQEEIKSSHQREVLDEVKNQITVVQSQIDNFLPAIQKEISSLQQSISQNDSEIDALQIGLSKTNRPLYLDPTVIISLLALLFSFGTTATSYYRTRQQDIHDARAELRGFLQRLSVLPKENLEVMSHPDKLVAAQLSAAINAENSLIANQAAEVMDRIPDYVSAIEYIVVANAFSSVGIYDKAEKLLKRATEVSKDVNEEVGAIRAYAALLFASGNINAGREMFQKALNIHEKYPSRIPLFQIWTNVYTEMQWAAAELGQRQCSESQTHITKASEQVSNFPSGPNKEVLLQQVTQIQKNIDSCK